MKKHTIILTTILLAGFLAISQTARAGDFRDRQEQQNYRIRQGIASGQITPKEAQNLYRDQRQLRQLERYFLADGHLSGIEDRLLDIRLAKSSDKIYRYKHNTLRMERARFCDSGHRIFVRR